MLYISLFLAHEKLCPNQIAQRHDSSLLTQPFRDVTVKKTELEAVIE